MSAKSEDSSTFPRVSLSESSRTRETSRVAVNGVSVLRPYAPQLIPILVCLFLIPFAVCVSLFAGWRVWKSLSVGWEVPLYLQYGERLIPYAVAALPPIQTSRPYDISLRMSLPISDSNMSLGNFMTTLTLMTPSNQTISSVSRPALVLPPKSSWIFGASSAIDLDVSLFSSFVVRTTDVLALVEVGRRDGWKSIGDGRGRELSVLSATLCGREIPRGIRGLAIRYPLVASSLAACIFLLILSLMIGTCVLPTMFPIPVEEVDAGHQSQNTKNTSKSSSEPPPPSSGSRTRSHSTPLRQRKSKLHRRSSGSSRAVSFISLLSFFTIVTYLSDLNGTKVVPKTEDTTDDAPIVLVPSSVTATEAVPEVSAHSAGPSGGSPRENLRRRTSQHLDGSDEDQHPSNSED
ncbi:hypothetical protein NP233_g7939 [Leucocoprinus birnbaumii]|uniref:Seipin n=1 Tax=Leucocoprinus birnbaumii TaxID=56174 RepID=A0AAD5VNC7_9AGAR|nr:hypothetical protein NP233_g7939 [Leucocoprinus birnbaumii]